MQDAGIFAYTSLFCGWFIWGARVFYGERKAGIVVASSVGRVFKVFWFHCDSLWSITKTS